MSTLTVNMLPNHSILFFQIFYEVIPSFVYGHSSACLWTGQHLAVHKALK